MRAFLPALLLYASQGYSQMRELPSSAPAPIPTAAASFGLERPEQAFALESVLARPGQQPAALDPPPNADAALRNLAPRLEIEAPENELDSFWNRSAAAKEEFAQKTRQTAVRVNSRFNGPVTVLAPFGGSKISPFLELDADQLVIVGLEQPGRTKDILSSFGKDRAILSEVLSKARASGAMNTADVLSVPIVAQILGRLYLELGVSEVSVSYFGRNGASRKPLLTRFSFLYNGKPKEIVFLTHKIGSDQIPYQRRFPVETLRALNPGGFTWGYLSADGLGFFSLNSGNGLQKASAQFGAAIKRHGAVILDYPRLKAYFEGQNTADGIIFMQGRAPLDNYGFKLLSKVAVQSNVFGYSGLAKDDEIRIYRKPGTKGAPRSSRRATGVRFRQFQQIGETSVFRMK